MQIYTKLSSQRLKTALSRVCTHNKTLSTGSKVGVEVAALCGGMDVKAEKAKLKSRPHIVVATPGRLLDHLKTTKNFTLEYIKFMVSCCSSGLCCSPRSSWVRLIIFVRSMVRRSCVMRSLWGLLVWIFLFCSNTLIFHNSYSCFAIIPVSAFSSCSTIATSMHGILTIASSFQRPWSH